jgi:hypothetical protein
MTTSNETDRAALARALDLTLTGGDQGRVQQVRRLLAEDGWHSAAEFCACVRQREHLQLAPWEEPPVHIPPDEIDAIIARGPLANNQFGGAKLLKKMLAHHVSIFDPTPIDTLAARARDA